MNNFHVNDYIDENVICLISQEPIGSRVIYSYLQGGVSKGVPMTAYVAKVLEEIIMDLKSVSNLAW